MGEGPESIVTAGEWHLAGAASGVLLCGASGIASYRLALKMLAKGPVGALGAMVIGIVLRSVVGLGGSALAFTALRGWTAESNDKVAFWLWVLAAYLVTLIAEMALLARRLPNAAAAPRKG